jgi:hypothetical protein
MRELLKKIGETKDVVVYQYEFCDEDILRNRDEIDLFEEGEFIAKYIVLEFAKEDGKMFPQVEVYGTYFSPTGKRIQNAILTIDLVLIKPIYFKDIVKGKKTAGEILSLPWDFWTVEY